MATEPALLADSHAVLIGVSAYEYAEFSPIRAARNSVEAMRALLTDPALCGWPPERITVILNPILAVDLATQIADLAENTTGVLLIYYVGHGVLSTRADLCLTVTSTRLNRPKISGLAWDTVAEVLRTSPARIRLAILDCCFAGQAIEALAGDGDGSPVLADIAHVEGVYTLTATTRNRTAHVPPADQQDLACTSFTSELRDLIRSGIPDKPARLTLGDIYPVLRHRLRAKGLPLPNQRGTDTVHLFPFTANANADIDRHDPKVTDPDFWKTWLNSATDQTPFTEDALLARRFTTDKGIEFARVAGGARPCDQEVASGPGPADPGEMVNEFTSRGCTQVMTGVYLEQPGPNGTLEHPILVSVTILPFADLATARDVYNYVASGAVWNFPLWPTGSKPSTPGTHLGIRWANYRYGCRYVVVALAHRTDCSYDDALGPWLKSAAAAASDATGAHNSVAQ